LAAPTPARDRPHARRRPSSGTESGGASVARFDRTARARIGTNASPATRRWRLRKPKDLLAGGCASPPSTRSPRSVERSAGIRRALSAFLPLCHTRPAGLFVPTSYRSASDVLTEPRIFRLARTSRRAVSLSKGAVHDVG